MDVMTKIFCNFGAHQHYMRSLPLHLSQKELCLVMNMPIFQLTLRPTYDFIMELQELWDDDRSDGTTVAKADHEMLYKRSLRNSYKND